MDKDDNKVRAAARIFMAPVDLVQIYNAASTGSGHFDTGRLHCVPMHMQALARAAGEGAEDLADYRSVLCGLAMGSGLEKGGARVYLDAFMEKVNALHKGGDEEKFMALWGKDKTGMQMTILRAADARGKATHLYALHDEMRGATLVMGKDGIAEAVRCGLARHGMVYFSADMPQAEDKAGAITDGFYAKAARHRNDARFSAALSQQAAGGLDGKAQDRLAVETMRTYEALQQSAARTKEAVLSVVAFRNRAAAFRAEKLGGLLIRAVTDGRPVICTSVNLPDRAQRPVWGRSSAWTC